MNASLVQAHFQGDDLLAVIRDGVDHDTALRVLVHLGSNCYSYQEALEELIDLGSFPDDIDGPQ